MTTGLNTKLNTTFEDAVERVTRALADQGFGVLTRIDVTTTLKQKLGQDMEDYLILGACNPALAHRALEVDRQIGQLLPCNVVVRADSSSQSGAVLVEAMDPQIMIKVAAQPALQPIADEATTKLTAAIESLGRNQGS
ncbi:DUF302 domain-containing protein [Mycobacterium genavense]|uniref:DUF302 domain-containing protein n=1 Tax=Mycobacterium genavense TaxID=36812 RepID=UPI00046F666B|nr:DUF302 domain-containing protein [Mycobacterium genavense]